MARKSKKTNVTEQRTPAEERAHALRQARRYILQAQVQHVHFITTETSPDLWTITVEGERGELTDIPTHALPTHLCALLLMGRKLRGLRMSPFWYKYTVPLDKQKDGYVWTKFT